MMTASTSLTYFPAHLTHIIVAAIFGSVVVAITALEVYFIKSFTSAEMFFLTMQNVGIASTSGYFVSKTSFTTTGLTETTTKP